MVQKPRPTGKSKRWKNSAWKSAHESIKGWHPTRKFLLFFDFYAHIPRYIIMLIGYVIQILTVLIPFGLILLCVLEWQSEKRLHLTTIWDSVLSIVSALALVLRMDAWPALLRLATTQALLAASVDLRDRILRRLKVMPRLVGPAPKEFPLFGLLVYAILP